MVFYGFSRIQGRHGWFTDYIKKLSKKKTYYVRVRAYTTEDNGISNVKVYSPWSAVKKVKTK